MSWGSRSTHGLENSSMGGEKRSDILKLILYDLNSAIAPQDHRMMALQTAISEFDHDQDYNHDEELDHHADKILLQKLAFAFQVDRSSEEVAMICTALEMVYRASRPRIALSFAELRECVLPIFVEMLCKPLHLRKLEVLDLALNAKAEELGTQSIIDSHGVETGYHRSAQSVAYHGGDSGNLSSRSPASDDPFYRSYENFSKPNKPQPDEASFMTNDEDDDESLKKPSKHIDNYNAYSEYDSQTTADQSRSSGYTQELNENQSSQRSEYQKDVPDSQDDEQMLQESHTMDSRKVDDLSYDVTNQPDGSPKVHAHHNSLQGAEAFSGDHIDQTCESNHLDDDMYGLSDDQTYESNELHGNSLSPEHPGDTESIAGELDDEIGKNEEDEEVGFKPRTTGQESFDQLPDDQSDQTEEPLERQDNLEVHSAVETQHCLPDDLTDNRRLETRHDQVDNSFEPTSDGRLFDPNSETHHVSDDGVVRDLQAETEPHPDDDTDRSDPSDIHDRKANPHDLELTNDSIASSHEYEREVGMQVKDGYEHRVNRDEILDTEEAPSSRLGDRILAEESYEAKQGTTKRSDQSLHNEGKTIEDEGSLADYSSFAGDSYQDGRSLSGLRKGVTTDGKSQLLSVSDSQRAGDVDDNAGDDDRQFIGLNSNFDEQGEQLVEQPLHPAKQKDEEGTFIDEQNGSNQSFQSQSEASLQRSLYQRAYKKNLALDDDQSYDEPQGEYDRSFFSQHRSLYGRQDNDDESQYSLDDSLKKPWKNAYDVETVYSQEDDDQSRDNSLYSEGSYDNQRSYGDSLGKPFKSTLKRRGDLSVVSEEDIDDDSSPSFFSQELSQNPQTINKAEYTRPVLQTIDEIDSVQSNKSSTSAAARAILEKKIENERRMSEQVTILEAELELIRVEDSTNPIGISRALQVLRYFSRVLSAMVPMAYHPGLLDALVYQLERQAYGRYSDHFNHHDDGEPRSEADKDELASSRVDAIATIVNLACAEDNKAKMANHPGLLDAITTVALDDPSEEAREHAAIVLMNLAYEDDNKVLMVRHHNMLDTLAQLIQDYLPFTRRYASAALFTLACVVVNTEKMAIYCDGKIIECLRSVLANDPVDEARINAAEALFNMARNHTEETLQIMGDHPDLLATLAKAILTDYSADARIFCARALEWMSAGIHYPMSCHRVLLSALTVSAQWTKTSCIAEALKTQATLEENRGPMASHDGLLQALSSLAMLESLKDSDVRRSAIAALEMMSRADKARPYMAMNEHVMKALTKASYDYGEEQEYGEDHQGTPVTSKLLKQALKNLANSM